ALALKSSNRTPELLGLISYNVGAELSVWPILVPFVTDLFRQVQHDRHGQYMELASEGYQRLAGLGLDVGRIDDSQSPRSEPLTGHVMQHIEGVSGGRLIILVVCHEAATKIRRKNFRGLEMRPSEARLAASRRAD